ncbi:MAG: GNAT family N-acetyltransferase [Myxococcota bacterium]|nr:GNAT family N-acetyltransferase [Myxococcota bacterium]
MDRTLRTPRLILRDWRDEDLAEFARINADPEVMRHFPARLDTSESDAVAARIRHHFEKHGYGFWAVERVGGEPFLGFVGLAHVDFEASFTPAVEIGWRLARSGWGYGYASEAAERALDFAFSEARLAEVVSFTALRNKRSAAVMERIGMSLHPEIRFDHPKLPKGHPLSPHWLYHIKKERWRKLKHGR